MILYHDDVTSQIIQVLVFSDGRLTIQLTLSSEADYQALTDMNLIFKTVMFVYVIQCYQTLLLLHSVIK